MNTNEKGDIADLKVMLRARELGAIPCKPFAASARYDQIIDIDGRLHRVQIKYSNFQNKGCKGSSYVNLKRWDKARKMARTYDRSEIDAILVYLPEVDKICWLPPEVWEGRRCLTIRFQNARNGQSKNILMADQYFW